MNFLTKLCDSMGEQGELRFSISPVSSRVRNLLSTGDANSVRNTSREGKPGKSHARTLFRGVAYFASWRNIAELQNTPFTKPSARQLPGREVLEVHSSASVQREGGSASVCRVEGRGERLRAPPRQ